jgi:hypothetical protein
VIGPMAQWDGPRPRPARWVWNTPFILGAVGRRLRKRDWAAHRRLTIRYAIEFRSGNTEADNRSRTAEGTPAYSRQSPQSTQIASEISDVPFGLPYVQCFRRIQLCRDSGLSKEDIALAMGHSGSLVQEYLDLMAEFKIARLPSDPGTDGVQSTEA